MKKIAFSLKLFSFLVICFVLIMTGFYVYAYITPNIDLKIANQIEMYDKNEDIFYNSTDNNNWATLENISDHAINATISIEDKHFYKHQGFDYLRIIKAMISNIRDGQLNQGASTISQQYIKNLYLEFDKTWKRKIEEAFLTFELEVHNTKDEILEGYLNTINYGGVYGIESASKYYFNKSARDLTIAEASLLVGIPKNPSLYNPLSNYEEAKNRQKTVLESMVKNKYITKKEKEEIYNTKLIFYGKTEKEKLESVSYYRDAVLNELRNIDEIPESIISTGGIKIYTNLDLDAQEKLERIIDEEMDDNSNLQVGSLIADPKTGKILALVGGTNYNKSQYNRVDTASRQVGSTIKPFLYYAALENGFTASSTFTSEPSSFNLGDGKTYAPTNAGNRYANGKISLASAIAFSDNIYAVKTHLFLGKNVLVDTANRVGIKTELPLNASLPLGTTEISMIDYCNGFLTLADSGIKKEAFLISKVEDMDGNILYEHKQEEELVLNSKLVYILNEMLSNTYNYDFIDYTSPTMLSIAGLLTNKYAVKSGSTEYDYWTIGYNNDALVMVWNGYDDNTELTANENKINKQIWARAIESFLEGKNTSWYEIPDGVVSSLVNPITGDITTNSKSINLYYIKGTEPYFYTNNELNSIVD